MSNFFVAIIDNRYTSYYEEEKVLSKAGVTIKGFVIKNGQSFPEQAFLADALLINLFPVSSGIIKGLKKCKIISRYGVGFDNVDIEAATKAGIWVTNVPDYCVEEASDHAVALLLNCARRSTFVNNRIRQGAWNIQNEVTLHRIEGKCLGLIGFGKIGQAVCRKMKSFMLKHVFVYDPYIDRKKVINSGAIPVTKEELLTRSDFISVHVPLTEQTRGFLGREDFLKMKNSAIIINTSRGSVIEQGSLIRALEDKIISSAGLDVFEEEPILKDNPILRLDNVILTSHMAYYSEESLSELKTKAAANVMFVLQGKRPIYPVNNLS